MKARIRSYGRIPTVWDIARRILFFLDEDHPAVDRLSDILAHPTVLWVLDWLDTWWDRHRVSVKTDPWDHWNADSTMAALIHPILVDLRTKTHGAPYVDDEDVPQELRLNLTQEQIDSGDTGHGDAFFERWTWILDEIIWTMEQYRDSDWEDQYYTHHDQPGDSLHERLDKIEWDREGYEAHYMRMQNGTRLLGKYWGGMWD